MRPRKLSTLIASTAVAGAIMAFVLLSSTNTSAAQPQLRKQAPDTAVPATIVMDDLNLYKLFAQDQSDQYAFTQRRLTADQLAKNSAERTQKTLKLAHSDALKSGNDFYRAAMILQRGKKSDQLLFAHDLAVNALALGQSQASIVAANTEDQYLISIGKSPRYGVKNMKSVASKSGSVYGVTSTMRRTLGVDQGTTNMRRSQRLVQRVQQLQSVFHPEA